MSLAATWRLMRFDRPIGIWLLAWPTWWALWVASAGHPTIAMLVVFTAGVVVMRAAGCVANDLADYRFDAQVARTKQRPLASGELSVQQARWVLVGLLLIAAGLWTTLQPAAQWLGLGALGVALCYPFAKRWLVTPQLVLGIAFAFSIPMVFAQVAHAVPPSAWLLWLATVCWVFAYDTQYALSDREDDCRIGIYSSARFFGASVLVAIAVLQALMLTTLVWWGYCVHAPAAFYASVGVVLTLFAYQAWCFTRAPLADVAQRVFRHNQWVGLVIMIGIFFTN